MKRNTGLVTVKKCFVRPAHVDWSYCGASRVKGFSAIGATRGRPAKGGELPDSRISQPPVSTAGSNSPLQVVLVGTGARCAAAAFTPFVEPCTRRHRSPLRISRIHPLSATGINWDVERAAV